MAANHSMREQPFFMKVAGERVFAFLHRPAGMTAGAVVLCHALAEEKLWSHRVYVTFARELAMAGYFVLRFDMRGEGDSDREFEQSDVATRIEDTLQAVTVVAEAARCDEVVLVGHRFGGSIAAAAAAAAGGRIRSVVVWDPLPDPGEYFGALLRSNMATQMATTGKVTRTREALVASLLEGEVVVADGYGFGAAMYRGMEGLYWASRNDFFQRPTLILEVARGEQVGPSEALGRLAGAHPGLRVQVVAEPPFWRETRQFHRRAAAFTLGSLAWLRQAGP